MATSKDFTNISKDSEEMFDTCCSSCSDDNRITEAKKFCKECQLNFCKNCVRFHKKIPSLQSHEIVDVTKCRTDKVKQVTKKLPTEQCNKHHGQLMDMFCNIHDEVCCGVCIALKHRACANIDYVPDIAKGVLACEEFKDIKDSVAATINDMKQEQTIRTANIVKLDKEKDKLLDVIDKYQGVLIDQVKRIAESTRKEIRTEFESEKTTITADIHSLHILIHTLDTSLPKCSVTNEAQVFVNMKACKTTVKDSKSVLSELSSTWKTKHMTYTFNESARSMVSKIKSFGTPGKKEDVQEYEAQLYGKFSVKQNTDMSKHDITGICQLSDDSIVIIDYHHEKVKQLDSNYEIKNTLAVNGNPIGICDVNSNEVAVNIFNTGQIQFISVNDSICLTSTIQVDKSCNGIYYNGNSDELFTCCGKNINVYNKRGRLLKVLNTGPYGRPLFAATRQVIVKNLTDEIIVTDNNAGLISVDTEGKMNWFLQDKELSTAWGVCVGPRDMIFVSDSCSNKIIQIDKSGNKKGVLIGASEGLRNPFSVAFDSHRSRLIVGMNSNDIHVYTLCLNPKIKT
ncbi:uncharacterized protein LOC132754581 [Ruditapes philippinarum]|uniref:uncharacterized protein LOC132754581 n=1 Tax=Ruditapes philippinarum TaxID=129788 RepID=UPI00295B5610|nr:uncharacterized protein LOC132754581 [Ruditapes philippinarum]